ADYLEYLHCGKNGSLNGKSKNKLTWCIVTALGAASPEQRATLERTYGLNDAIAEARVREVFRAVDLTTAFVKYEGEARGRIGRLVEAMPEVESSMSGAVLRRQVFRNLLRQVEASPS
ncbi:hypothetical protein OF83DRAFT_1170053, partial [Amylostereum chailletii]